MKKNFFYLFLPLLAIALVSCSNKDEKGAAKYDLTVTITLPTGITESDVQEYTVTVSNESSGYESIRTLTELTTTYEQLTSGEYSVTVTTDVSPTEQLIGNSTVSLYADRNTTVTLAVAQLESPFIFKEIYYTSYFYYMKDTYFEIVNNTDEVQYLDQLMLGYVLRGQYAKGWIETYPDLYPLYGWVISFPGSGTSHPVEPGKSVVIANNPELHEVGDWSLDLTHADWDIYLPDSPVGDVDNTSVPNMDIAFLSGGSPVNYFAQGYFGGGYVLIKLPHGITPETFTADAAYRKPNPSYPTTSEFLMIPTNYVIDAVNVVDRTDEETWYNLFQPVNETGMTGVTEGFSGLSIRRKVTKIENGRAYYQDTNNSTNDFLIDQPLTPGVQPSSVD